MMSTSLWFKDAIFYELHVGTFRDSDGDGSGDFRGLIEKLDYFTELGVTALLLLPFQPSPLGDGSYSITDQCAVHPAYGTVEDFTRFLEKAHERGLRVITELVLNHTSDQHPWFQRARQAPAGSVEREFYVWSDDPRKYSDARVVLKDSETANWSWDSVANSYFWHRFHAHEPDLNFEHPPVREELLRVLEFWLALGVDGVRLHAAPFLCEREQTNCENLSGTHDFLRALRRYVDEKFPDRALLADANQWPEDTAAYFGAGDECHLVFHFPLVPRIFLALQREDRTPIVEIIEQTPAIPESCQWAIFLRNHDALSLEMVTEEEREQLTRVYARDPRARFHLGIRRRLAPLLGNDRRRIELLNALLFSLPGTPFLHYGDEVGMGDDFSLSDCAGLRTPMPWTARRNAGFSEALPDQLCTPLIVEPGYGCESVNVESQQKSESSLLSWMRRLLAVRARFAAFAQGGMEFVSSDNAKVLAYVRRKEDEVVLVVANLSGFAQVAELELSAFAGRVPEELFGHSTFPKITTTPALFTLSAHGFFWLQLRPETGTKASETMWEAPQLPGNGRWDEAVLTRLARSILPAYVPACRWFGDKGREIRDLKIVRNVPIGSLLEARLLVIEIAFTDGLPESYVLPLMLLDEAAGAAITAEAPRAILARFEGGGLICDAVHVPEVRAEFLRLIARGGAGHHQVCLSGGASAPFDETMLVSALAHSRVISAEQSNTSVIYGDAWFLKLFRKFERGPNPDLEVTQFLSEGRGFAHVPPYAGGLRLIDPAGDGVIALLAGFTPNQGDGWTFTLDALARFFAHARQSGGEASSAMLKELIGEEYSARARQLGVRTAEMHRALASGEDRPEFAAEAFTALYQRSLYQSMRSAASRVLVELQRRAPHLPESIRSAAIELSASQDRIFTRFARLLSRKIPAAKTRVHGDYHLGQVLNTGTDFVILDFEGEPRLTLGERLLKRSPLRDVAGMLRSFDYAVSVALRLQDPTDAAKLEPWARGWADAICAQFLDSYLATARGAAFLPPDPADVSLLLEVFILDKAIYEIGYEVSYRPDFLPVPLGAVLRLLAERDVSK